MDLISRQAAIDAMLRLQAEDDEDYGCHIPEGFDGERAKEALEQLPSAQQKPLKYSGESICVYCMTGDCAGCEYEPMEGVMDD